MAYALYECNRCENRHDETLRRSASILKEVSGIDVENWDALKLVSALKVISYPEEEFEYDFFDESGEVSPYWILLNFL
jgi:nucleolar protein 58